jgi:hypothetical protein
LPQPIVPSPFGKSDLTNQSGLTPWQRFLSGGA